jgi:hypothetical protein
MMVVAIWVIYGCCFSLIMSIGLMDETTRMLVRVLGIKYKVNGVWTDNMVHSANYFTHPILVIGDKEYKLSVSIGGGNTYNEHDNIRRKAIIYSLLGRSI